MFVTSSFCVIHDFDTELQTEGHHWTQSEARVKQILMRDANAPWSQSSVARSLVD